MFQNVFNGNMKLKEIKSLEPFYLEKVNIFQGNGKAPISLDATLTNLKISGISSGELLNHTANFEKSQWTSVFKIPKIKIESDYQMKVSKREFIFKTNFLMVI